jgi:2-(1,2-epoxy-1,2-dihydrophenyl)acetyl-CoA isomerase
MMLGDKINAEEAERMGMIYKALPDETFMQEANKIATTLANMPTIGLALTKQLLDNSIDNDLEDQLHDEEIFQNHAGRTEDYKEGVQAFLEKRKPIFKGH